MEYFNFDDAAPGGLAKQPNAFDEAFPELMGIEPQAPAGPEPVLPLHTPDEATQEPRKPWPPAALDKTNRLRVNNTYVEVERQPDEVGGDYPMFRAKTPCDLCRRMGMDCFISQRGALINGCTCCISLYRECSFTFAQRQERGQFLDVLSKVTEDAQECEGSLVTKRALKSFEESRPRKNGSRLSRDAVKALKNWLNEHADHPYPTDAEKEHLENMTGLKRNQVSNWLANARRRGKVRSIRSHSSSVVGPVDIPRPPPASVDAEAMSPLERWKHSPPEHEAASVTDIARAMVENPDCCSSAQPSHQNSRQNSRHGSRRTSSNDDSGMSMLQAPSLSSLDTSRSSASGLSSSALSHRSRGSFGSMDAKDRRRRRRVPAASRRVSHKQGPSRIFQCTFCADSFASKYDWQRHEKSLHLALERWVCAPAGGIVEVEGQQLCAFCRAPNPTNDHLDTHNFSACQEKTLADRTFYRKDHLRQHLKLLHSSKFDPSMESWKSMVSEIKSSCGFCPAVFTTWEQRVDHLASHFKCGANMSWWADGWGFEPHIEALVENSVPPYMNDNERASMDPFVAQVATPSTEGTNSNSCNLTLGTSAASSILADSNCWRRLEQVLGGYIQQQVTMGHVPTDLELQDEGRRIVYDDEDPWNQTAADNEKWLASMKFKYGIGPLTGQAPRKLEELALMPPYAILGGLKHGGGPCAVEPHIAEPVSTMGDGLSGSMAAAFDPLSDIDFNQLNFDGVDGMDLTLDEGMGPLAATSGSNLDLSAYSASWQNPAPLAADFGMPNALFEIQAMEGIPPVTDEEMAQLSGFVPQFSG